MKRNAEIGLFAKPSILMSKKKMTEPSLKILVVDDSPSMLEVIQRNLSTAGYDVFTASNVESAMDLLETSPVDLIITDLKMPKVSGLDLIKYVRENLSDVEIMMITGYPSIEGAVAAVKKGAEEYLVKPFTDKELLSAVQRMFEKLARRRTVQSPKCPTKFYDIIGASKGMQNVFRLIPKAAATTATVLISGQSGTGKELVARAIHYNSDSCSAPFVPVNCTAIPDNLLESELFGHVKGAFTGAKESRAGFFQVADGGTIFLDEIGDASANLQGKLLRVIQNKEVRMVGSSHVRKVDTRIVAATNKELLSLVKKGLFREDLYYRLNVINIAIPPLNERGDDILLLANHFISKFAKEMNRPVPTFSDDVLQALKRYTWPGNVRELENLIQRLIVITDADFIDVTDLPVPMRFSFNPRKGINRTIAEVEAEHMLMVLESVGGNKTQAARILGVDRKTLREKLRKLSDQTGP